MSDQFQSSPTATPAPPGDFPVEAALTQAFAPEGILIPASGTTVVLHSPAMRHIPAFAPAGRGTVGFESSEHTYLGDQATLHFEDGDVIAARLKIPIGAPYTNATPLTYGSIVALAGDFYGAPGESPISDSADIGGSFEAAFKTLASGNPGQTADLLQIIEDEINAVNAAVKRGAQPSTAFSALGQSISKRANRATGGGSRDTDWWPLGRYMRLAQVNWDHFGQAAVNVYTAGHKLATDRAAGARQLPTPAQRKASLWVAYAFNAFADHFLTDLFSAGHLRTPRKELYNHAHLEGSICAWYMHDEECCWGLRVRNAQSTGWIAYGDKKLLDDQDRGNLAIVQQAVQASIDDVWAAFNGQPRPTPSALQLIPDLTALATVPDHTNPSPVFIVSNGNVLRRKDVANRDDLRWGDWWVEPTLIKLAAASGCDNTELPIPVSITSRLVQIWSSNSTLAMTVYQPDEAAATGFSKVWKSSLPGNGPNATAWLLGNATGSDTADLIQVYPKDGGVGFTVFQASEDGGYREMPKNVVAHNGTDGAWLSGNVVSGTLTDIIQAWSDSGSTAFTVYTANLSAGTYLQATKATVVPKIPYSGIWLTGNVTERDGTDVIQVSSHGGNLVLTTYSPADGQFSAVATTSPAGNKADAVAWLTGSVAGGDTTDLLQVWSDGGTVAITTYRADGTGSFSQLSKATMSGNGTGQSVWFVGRVDPDGPTAVIQVWYSGDEPHRSLALTVYLPDSQGKYAQAWKGNLGLEFSTLNEYHIVSTINDDGMTDIVMIAPPAGFQSPSVLSAFVPMADGTHGYKAGGHMQFPSDGVHGTWLADDTFVL